ncbi:MAG TPA: dihydroorotase [Dehalococcoidales bacterium]|nr:dihydroorotase [Dehalococcoidales bacterium]
MPLLVRGGRLFDPAQGIDSTGSLLIDGGTISWLGAGEAVPPSGCDILPVQGFIVCPGFVDLHCHLREPGFEEKETISTGTLAAARGGFTTVCCMPNTEPPLDNGATIKRMLTTAAEEGMVRVLPVGCITKGRKGEELVDMAELASVGVIGFSDDGDPVPDSGLMRRALECAREVDLQAGLQVHLPVIEHCEDKALTGDGVLNEGVVSARLGLRGIPAAAEEIMVARNIGLAGSTGGHLHVAHVSTKGSVELVRRAKHEGLNVTAEVTPHHLTLTEEEVAACGANARVNPPLRTEQDIAALIEGLVDDTIDAIATDHAPHTEAEKNRGLEQAPSGISGFETAFGALMSLVHTGRLPLPTLIRKLTSAPAALLGERFGKLGTLEIGAAGDIVIIDPDMEWVVDTAKFASKGRNTPLAGRTLKGRVMATICGGRVVYRDESVRF